MAFSGLPMVDKLSKSLEMSMPLHFLKDRKIGVDAEYFLERYLLGNRETLLAALGGAPLVTGPKVRDHLRNIKASGCELYFIFNGLENGTQRSLFAVAEEAAKRHNKAFRIYEDNRAKDACGIFKSSGVPTASELCEFLKLVLHEAGIPFTVAPYSAAAQLAYLEGLDGQYIDGIYGSSETLLYGTKNILTRFDMGSTEHEEFENGYPYTRLRFALEKSSVAFLQRDRLIEQTMGMPDSLLQDALLLSGSHILAPFPPLESLFERPSLRDVVHLMMAPAPRSALQLCAAYAQHPSMKDKDYVSKYKRALASIKHPVINAKDGTIGPKDQERAPSDVHDCVGLQLPWDLLHLLKYGAISPRVLSQLTTGLIQIRTPLGGGESKHFQDFTEAGLNPIRKQCLGLLTGSLNRWYGHREIAEKFYFDPDNERTFATRNLPDLPTSLKWQVKRLPSKSSGAKSDDSINTTDLLVLLESLTDESFAKSTLPSSKAESALLSSSKEIESNATWRFFQLRGYIGDNHRLTPSGKLLVDALGSCGGKPSQQEAILIAFELLRQNRLNANSLLPSPSTAAANDTVQSSSAPAIGSSTDRHHTTLINRVSSLGKQTHLPRGYTGPLDRHILSYHSITSSLRQILRDLLEMCLATMFLDGQIDRKALSSTFTHGEQDLFTLNLSLPLKEEPNCALGVMMNAYFEEIAVAEGQGKAIDESIKTEVKMKMKEWIPGADTEESFGDAGSLWNAVYKAVETNHGVFPDVQVDEWKEANEWFSQRW